MCKRGCGMFWSWLNISAPQISTQDPAHTRTNHVTKMLAIRRCLWCARYSIGDKKTKTDVYLRFWGDPEKSRQASRERVRFAGKINMKIARRVTSRQLLSMRCRAMSSQRRTDAEYIQLLQRELAGHHAASLHQFTEMWQKVAETISAENPTPVKVLDLASGTNAEPACTLAERFSAANIVASEYTPELCAIAMESVKERGLADRVEVRHLSPRGLETCGRCNAAAAAAATGAAAAGDAVPLCLRSCVHIPAGRWRRST